MLQVPHPGHGLADALGARLQYARQGPQLVVVTVHFVESHPLGRRFHEVHDIVHLRNQTKDVVAVNGCDEYFVQTFHHVVGDVIALVLDDLDLRTGLRRGDLALGHLDERPAPIDGFLRVFLEVVEEGFFPRQKSHLGGLYRRTALACQCQKKPRERADRRARPRPAMRPPFPRRMSQDSPADMAGLAARLAMCEILTIPCPDFQAPVRM